MKSKFRIALVEDDPEQLTLTAELIDKYLQNHEFLRIVSEQQFRSELTQGSLATCDAIVMDVMLRWTSLEAFVPLPPNYGGYYEAGLRCIRELRQTDWGRLVPLIVYTLLEPQDVAEPLDKLGDVAYVNKAQPGHLLARLRKLAQDSD